MALSDVGAEAGKHIPEQGRVDLEDLLLCGQHGDAALLGEPALAAELCVRCVCGIWMCGHKAMSGCGGHTETRQRVRSFYKYKEAWVPDSVANISTRTTITVTSLFCLHFIDP